MAVAHPGPWAPQPSLLQEGVPLLVPLFRGFGGVDFCVAPWDAMHDSPALHELLGLSQRRLIGTTFLSLVFTCGSSPNPCGPRGFGGGHLSRPVIVLGLGVAGKGTGPKGTLSSSLSPN